MTPTIREAFDRVERRKGAAGLKAVNTGPEAFAAVLSGTDLTRVEYEEAATRYGKARGAMAFVLGPITASATAFADGLVTGLELAELRRLERGTEATLRELRRRTLELAEAVLEADDVGDLSVNRSVRLGSRFRPNAGVKGAEARNLAEAIIETVR